MYSELLEFESPIPIPSVGDIGQINRSGLFKITDRKLIYEGLNLSVYLTGEAFEDPLHEIIFPKNQ